MKFFLTVVLLFLMQEVYAKTHCGGSNLIGQYSSSTQNCNRCKYSGGEIHNNCAAKHRKATVIKLASISNDQFTDPKYVFTLRHSFCKSSFGEEWRHDGCRSLKKSRYVEMDSTKIVSRLEDCSNDYYRQTFSGAIIEKLSGKICLVKVSRDNVKNYAKDFPLTRDDNFNDVVCAFDVTGGGDDIQEKSRKWTKIGCAPYPMLQGAPPFTNGYLPKLSFVVPKVTSKNAFNINTTFQYPVAILNVVMGRDTIDNIELPIALEQGQKNNCIRYGDNGNIEFCAEIDASSPEEIKISKNNIQIGTYLRPAIEQKNSKISFFPCYHTYKDKSNNMYQGIYVFSINANKGDEIGQLVDSSGSKPLYLGPHYLPSHKQDAVGEILTTKCDLCVNAAETQEENWQDNVYSNGYSISSNLIGACNLNPEIEIKKITLVDSDNKEITYPVDQNNPQPLVSAPLRVDTFDIDEQKDFDAQTIDYSYESQEGGLRNYLVTVKPVIPIFKDNSEADYVTAVKSDEKDNCDGYKYDSRGTIFIKPAGKRNTNFCLLDPTKPNAFFTLCGRSSNEIYDSICPGLYQGSANQSILPDKICLMSANEWDFIAGRYTYQEQNLNGDNQIVPTMSCTFLPGCKSLGSKPVKNIGYAIWNAESNFSDTVQGKCQEIDYNSSLNDDKYTYQYEISEYTILDAAKNDPKYNVAFEDALKSLKDKYLNNPYISETSLKDSAALHEFYSAYKDSQKRIFGCKIKIPEAKCIGGIYGDLKKDSACTLVKNHGIPVNCELQ